MNRDPRSMPPADLRAASRIGRFWDVLVADDGRVPEIPSDLSGLAATVLRLHDAPRPPAPAAVHDRVRAMIAADPVWASRVWSVPLSADPDRLTANGQTPAAPTAPPPWWRERPRPVRRAWPVIEFALLAAAILVLFYVGYTLNQDDTAVQPTPTVAPAPTTVASPTAAAVTPTPQPAGAVGDWPMLGGGPSRSAGTDRQIPATLPTLRWEVQVSPGARGIVAAGDKLYVTDGGTLFALDITTGEERWRVGLGVAPSAPGANPPAVVGGVVYLANRDGTIFALDAGTGAERWRYPTGASITIALAVDAGTVYAGMTAGHLIALDAATGDRRWEAEIGAITSSSPVIADGVVFVGSGSNTVVAVDATNGVIVWEKEVWRGMKSVTVGEGLAIAGSHSMGSVVKVAALDTASGDLVWSQPALTELPAAIVDGTAYVFSDGVLAFDCATGAQRWRFLATQSVVDAAVVGETLVIVERGGTVTAVDAATGKDIWNVATGTDATALTVGAGIVYVAHKDGTITAIA